MRDSKRKIRVDRLIGKPISWVLNTAARLLGRLLGRDHGISRHNVRTIAISKYVGMGSIIQATPLIRSLRRTYPEATIIFVTGAGSRRMVERLDDIDRIITIDDGNMVSVVRTTARAIGQLILRPR